MSYTATTISDLIGKTLAKIEKVDNDELHFYTSEGKHFRLYHNQDCCETVYLAESIGDLDDLLHNPILTFEERTEDHSETSYDSATWTFYEIATIKGSVTLRWVGESNGYYSESVDFEEITEFWDKQGVVHEEAGQWFYWDENYIGRFGPSNTEQAAKDACREYASKL